MRQITFTAGDPVHARYFDYVFRAALEGPTVDAEGRPVRRSWDEQVADGRVVTKLKAISHDVVLDPVRQVTRRELNTTGGTLTLGNVEFAKLERWWRRIQWPPHLMDEIPACYEWLAGASEAPDTPDDATP